MSKNYNTIPDQLNAISWNLKRIADALEEQNDRRNRLQRSSSPDTDWDWLSAANVDQGVTLAEIRESLKKSPKRPL